MLCGGLRERANLKSRLRKSRKWNHHHDDRGESKRSSHVEVPRRRLFGLRMVSGRRLPLIWAMPPAGLSSIAQTRQVFNGYAVLGQWKLLPRVNSCAGCAGSMKRVGCLISISA